MLEQLAVAVAHDPTTTGTAMVIAAAQEPNTTELARWLRDIFGPLFLAMVSVVAIFFLFTREITRFAQFIILAIVIAVIFYVPNIIETTARAIARALGVA